MMTKKESKVVFKRALAALYKEKIDMEHLVPLAANRY